MRPAFWQALVKWVEPVRTAGQMVEDVLPLAIMRHHVTMGRAALASLQTSSQLTLIIILNN